VEVLLMPKVQQQPQFGHQGCQKNSRKVAPSGAKNLIFLLPPSDRRFNVQNPISISSSPPEPFVSAFEAGGFVKLHPSTVLRLAREGVLPAHPIGNGTRKRWRFLLSELQAWLVSQPEQ
jgi:hypothetical protein